MRLRSKGGMDCTVHSAAYSPARAAILVGGRAQRFGCRDKSALVVGGRTILDRQLEAVAQVTDDLMFVTSGASGFHPSETIDMASGSSRTGYRVIADRVADSG